MMVLTWLVVNVLRLNRRGVNYGGGSSIKQPNNQQQAIDVNLWRGRFTGCDIQKVAE